MAGRGFGAVVEGRAVAGGRLVFAVLVGLRHDAVSCCGRFLGGCGHPGQGSLVSRFVEGGRHRGPRGGPGVSVFVRQLHGFPDSA